MSGPSIRSQQPLNPNGRFEGPGVGTLSFGYQGQGQVLNRRSVPPPVPVQVQGPVQGQVPDSGSEVLTPGLRGRDGDFFLLPTECPLNTTPQTPSSINIGGAPVTPQRGGAGGYPGGDQRLAFTSPRSGPEVKKVVQIIDTGAGLTPIGVVGTPVRSQVVPVAGDHTALVAGSGWHQGPFTTPDRPQRVPFSGDFAGHNASPYRVLVRTPADSRQYGDLYALSSERRYLDPITPSLIPYPKTFDSDKCLEYLTEPHRTCTSSSGQAGQGVDTEPDQKLSAKAHGLRRRMELEDSEASDSVRCSVKRPLSFGDGGLESTSEPLVKDLSPYKSIEDGHEIIVPLDKAIQPLRNSIEEDPASTSKASLDGAILYMEGGPKEDKASPPASAAQRHGGCTSEDVLVHSVPRKKPEPNSTNPYGRGGLSKKNFSEIIEAGNGSPVEDDASSPASASSRHDGCAYEDDDDCGPKDDYSVQRIKPKANSNDPYGKDGKGRPVKDDASSPAASKSMEEGVVPSPTKSMEEDLEITEAGNGSPVKDDASSPAASKSMEEGVVPSPTKSMEEDLEITEAGNGSPVSKQVEVSEITEDVINGDDVRLDLDSLFAESTYFTAQNFYECFSNQRVPSYVSENFDKEMANYKQVLQELAIFNSDYIYFKYLEKTAAKRHDNILVFNSQQEILAQLKVLSTLDPDDQCSKFYHSDFEDSFIAERYKNSEPYMDFLKKYPNGFDILENLRNVYGEEIKISVYNNDNKTRIAIFSEDLLMADLKLGER